MTDRLDVFYNDTCPICSREVDAYKRKTDGDVVYHGLSREDLSKFGLDEDRSAREFHVVRNGELIAGLPAFAALWERIPGMRWLARLVLLPVIAPVLDWVYRNIAARVLYRMHKRRRRAARAACNREVSR